VQGYYHDRKAMSYDFILENIYFAGLLFWQSIYLCFFKSFRQNNILFPLEILLTFFPYYTIRNYFPKSSFRNSTNNGNKYAVVVKIFYCIAKHISGYYINYLCFLGIFGNQPIIDYGILRKLLLLGGWGTTISMFLQTLKFKKYISSNVAMILYAGSFPLFYTCYLGLFAIFIQNYLIGCLTLVGLLFNFIPKKYQILWQLIICTIFITLRLKIINFV
ncbi:unnamed protein product, partial [marine sediment metagenome]